MDEQRYRVGELAHLCGVNRRTIDFYTHAGLLLPVERSPGGHRFYGAGAVHRLRLIKALQAEGLSLAACDWHPSAADERVIADKVMRVIDGARVWSGQ